MDYEDLVTEYEELAQAFMRYFDNQNWTIVHMGGVRRRAVIILTEDEYETIKRLSAHSEEVVSSLTAY